ncbi:MAG: GatB/YqeY domain-containing protein [Dictyoglomus sp.]|nr:GatB/YqeY domain-containing protein [Dictyoglomus sp.]MCX7845510.1 GatB/YqeY domain-containing protein [Dictyoglomaceae bacterium]MDW8189305.1 GatB/YqeY domain-containing protein [Dictyoglomus sp.]
MLYEKITKDYLNAVKNKDSFRVEVLSFLRSAIKYREIDLREKGKEMTDEDVIDVINKEIKKRKEAIELYKKGERFDLAEKEERELKILEGYLPEQLSDEDLEDILKRIIEEVEAKDIKDLGKVMKLAMSELKGKAEGERIKKIVEELLKSK